MNLLLPHIDKREKNANIFTDSLENPMKNWYCKRRVTKFYTASVDYCENAKLLWSFVNNSIAHSVMTFSFHLKLHNLCETLRLTTFYSNSVNPKTSICRPGLPKKLQLNALKYQKNFFPFQTYSQTILELGCFRIVLKKVISSKSTFNLSICCLLNFVEELRKLAV